MVVFSCCQNIATDVKAADLKPTDLKPTDLKPTDLRITDLKVTNLKATDLSLSLLLNSRPAGRYETNCVVHTPFNVVFDHAWGTHHDLRILDVVGVVRPSTHEKRRVQYLTHRGGG